MQSDYVINHVKCQLRGETFSAQVENKFPACLLAELRVSIAAFRAVNNNHMLIIVVCCCLF